MAKEETILYATLGIGAFILLYKSNFFEKLGSGVTDIAQGYSTGIENIGTGLGGGLYNVGMGINELGYGLGSGLNNIGMGINKLGSGFEWTGKGLYQIGTGAGTLLGGTAPANILQAFRDDPNYYQLPTINGTTPKQDTLSPTKSSGLNVLTGAGGAISAVASKILSTPTKLLSNVKSTATKEFQVITSTTQNLVTTLPQTIEHTAKDIYTGGTKIINKVTSPVKAILRKIF